MSNPFLIRLRGAADGIVDLAENEWEIHGGVTGSAENGLYFNGTSYITMSDSSKSLGTGDFTISMWITQNAHVTYASTGLFISPGIIFFLYNNEVQTSSGIATTSSWKMDNLTISMYNVGQKIHIALVRYNGQVKLYVNGMLSSSKIDWIGDNSLLRVAIGASLNSVENSYYCGYIDDVCVIKDKALWTSDFTPPTGYLSIESVIYLSGQEVWGIDGSGNFAKLSNNYSAMTPAEKIAMFDATAGQVPTIAQLKTLTMPIKAVNYNDENTQPTCTVTAIPTPQTVTPKGRISLKNYAKLKGVTITGTTSGNGSVKVAVTKDNSTYQVYDTTNLAWVDINIADIGTDGMSLSDVASLTTTEWAAYDCMSSGIGFAYYLEMASTSDTAYTDELTLNVELLGELKSLVKGTDYDYSYVSNDVLQVKLFKNGDFRINYNPGES